MGKKVRKKPRSGVKEKRVSNPTQKTVAEESISSTEAVDDGLPVVKDRKGCTHLDKGIDLVKISSRIASIERSRCEDCREDVIDRRASKGRGKQGKKKGGGSADTKPENKAIWICLECGHFSCGGIGLPTTPQSHAVRHARQTRHPVVIQFENLQLRWCFPCNTLIPLEKSDESGEHKDLLSDLVKLIKGRSSQTSADVEDVWLGTGSVLSAIKSKDIATISLDGRSGYVVRGLVNLGNTCFFNSIMQNLLAMKRLRKQLLELDDYVGPLIISLKKLFLETCPEAGLRNVITPRSVFGCVCAKAPQFRGFQQHDSHELLRCLLDGLCTEELCAKKQTTYQKNGISSNLGHTFVDAIFGGQLCSTVSCLECGYSSTVFEPFLDLSLPVPTKKTPSKRAQPISRAKKPKLPPKRSGRFRPTANKVADSGNVQSCAPESVSLPLAGSASCSHVQSSAALADKVADVLADSTLFESIGPSMAAHNNVTGEEFEENPCPKNVTDHMEASLDSSTCWLDFLGEPDPVLNDHDAASEANDIALIPDSGKQDAVQDDASLQGGIESNRQVPTLCTGEAIGSLGNLTRLDFLESGTLSDDGDVTSKVNDVLVNQESIGNDAVQSEVSSQNRSGPSTLPGNSFENGLPLQVQVSGVLLLPYKEVTSTTDEILSKQGEVSSSTVGCTPDALDFDGLGDLFNEPEIIAGPSVRPSSADNNIQAEQIAETGFLFGNNSESDPDEVDNSDSPVSVESCLAYFIKPELLSNEHAWHCENCSKALQEQRMKPRKKEQKVPKIQLSEVDCGNQSAPSSSTKYYPCTSEKSTLSGGDISKHVVSASDETLVSVNGTIDDNGDYKEASSLKHELNLAVPQSEEGNGEMNDALAEPSQSLSSYKSCSQATMTGEASDSCTANEASKVGCEKEVQQIKLQLPAGSESEGNDIEETNNERVKVKRAATKRFLIDRAPPILTIHLKRFSQDARGRLSKLHGHVDFRDTIDLRPYMDPRCTQTDECKFHLIGVVEHQGNMRGGHYVAYVRGAKGSRKPEKENEDFVWYHASDVHVREVSLEQVLRSEAYILFYEKF